MPKFEIDDVLDGVCWMQDDPYESQLIELTKMFHAKGYGYLGFGQSRVVFLSPNGKYVFKIPTEENEAYTNETEYEIYKLKLKSVPVARCRLIYYHTIPIIIMELVDVVDDDIPGEWYDYDGGQCGYNRKGNLVLFDMGYSGHLLAA